ncbi:MAG: aldo/keto reductase [Candidatus Limnocylindrales bacterium]
MTNPGTAVQTQPFAPLARDLARIGLGTSAFRIARQDAAFGVLDAWAELGGDLVDLAARYGAGEAETVLGTWMAARNARDGVVILTKGAHPDAAWRSRMTPKAIASDLRASLDRLGTDVVDIYMLHRDDPAVPVGEIVDALHEQVVAGRARSVGVSNWTIPRIDAALAYSADRGRTPITSSSVYVGLAPWREPPWPDCVDGRDPISQAWYGGSGGLPNFAWSAQSGGVFADDFDAARVAPEIAAAWDTPETEALRLRARAVARELRATAAQVAIAYVLGAAGAPFALTGARDPDALRAAWGAVDLSLSEEQRQWLERGEA